MAVRGRGRSLAEGRDRIWVYPGGGDWAADRLLADCMRAALADEPVVLRAPGAIRPWRTHSYRECQDDMEKMARKYGFPLDVPWREMDEAHRRWVIDGDADWVSWRKSWPGKWYGVKRFFEAMRS